MAEPDDDEAHALASVHNSRPLPRLSMPMESMPKEVAYRLIDDVLMCDGKPRQNFATFTTTYMEPECDQLFLAAMNKNFVNSDEYPVNADLEKRCVNMIARMYHAPVKESDDAVGVSTVGSSEAIMLALLALKTIWKARQAEGAAERKPNLVIGANCQVCWLKAAKYCEVELREVALYDGCYVMDPARAVDMVDGNTIGVAAIFGSTYNGELEDVQTLNRLLLEKGCSTPIHVDAAIGGFVAPFLWPELEWDFRLRLVQSINVSGHKYGLVYPGVGWAIWRDEAALPEELKFHINYLSHSHQEACTVNFSKSSSQVVAQYYQLVRLGHQGYKRIIKKCHENAVWLAEALERTGRFSVVSRRPVAPPIVAFSLKDRRGYDEFAVVQVLRQYGWMLPAYKMPPELETVSVIRAVVRPEHSRGLIERLVADIQKAVGQLDDNENPT